MKLTQLQICGNYSLKNMKIKMKMANIVAFVFIVNIVMT